MLSRPEEPAADPTPPPAGPRVLLVDGNEHDLKHFTMLLQEMDFSVWAFTDYREGERFLAEGNFDLVIVGQGGSDSESSRLALFTLGRERYTPVVVLTRSPEIEGYIRAMQLGVVEYLAKTPDCGRVPTSGADPFSAAASARVRRHCLQIGADPKTGARKLSEGLGRGFSQIAPDSDGEQRVPLR